MFKLIFQYYQLGDNIRKKVSRVSGDIRGVFDLSQAAAACSFVAWILNMFQKCVIRLNTKYNYFSSTLHCYQMPEGFKEQHPIIDNALLSVSNCPLLFLEMEKLSFVTFSVGMFAFCGRDSLFCLLSLKKLQDVKTHINRLWNYMLKKLHAIKLC